MQRAKNGRQITFSNRISADMPVSYMRQMHNLHKPENYSQFNKYTIKELKGLNLIQRIHIVFQMHKK